MSTGGSPHRRCRPGCATCQTGPSRTRWPGSSQRFLEDLAPRRIAQLPAELPLGLRGGEAAPLGHFPGTTVTGPCQIGLASPGPFNAASVRAPSLHRSRGDVAVEKFAREPRQLSDLGFRETDEEALSQSAMVGVLRTPEPVQPGVGENDDHSAGIPLVADPADETLCLQAGDQPGHLTLTQRRLPRQL